MKNLTYHIIMKVFYSAVFTHSVIIQVLSADQAAPPAAASWETQAVRGRGRGRGRKAAAGTAAGLKMGTGPKSSWTALRTQISSMERISRCLLSVSFT